MTVSYIVDDYAIGGYGQRENFGGSFGSLGAALDYIGMRERTYAGWNIVKNPIQIIDDTPIVTPTPAPQANPPITQSIQTSPYIGNLVLKNGDVSSQPLMLPILLAAFIFLKK